jgi:phosphoribosyl 1,2-cyclic phosphate phosphodiesterase
MIACSCKVCTSENPKDKRLRSSILIQNHDLNIVVDTTPDFRYQMLRVGLKRLDAILITHSHKDHIAGMDDVRAFNYFQKKPVDIYATLPSQEVIKKEFSYAFAENKYPGIPEIRLHTIDSALFQVGGLPILPVGVLHYKMPVTGFRIDDFTYITDANYISEKEKEKIKGTKILVLNALRSEHHVSHFSLPEALALADELKVERAYFTHISHQLGLHDEVSSRLPKGRYLAYDGLTLEM